MLHTHHLLAVGMPHTHHLPAVVTLDILLQIQWVAPIRYATGQTGVPYRGRGHDTTLTTVLLPLTSASKVKKGYYTALITAYMAYTPCILVYITVY